MKYKTLILLISLLALRGLAQTADSLDPLVKSYIQAINTRNTNALRELIYPACRTNLTESEEIQLKNRLDIDLNLTIPENANIKISDYSGYALYGDAAIWKVKPTKEIEIRYKLEKGGKIMNRFAAPWEGKWYLVLPYVDMKKIQKQIPTKDPQDLRNEVKTPPTQSASPKPATQPDQGTKKEPEKTP
jgi:hypothetical protein